MRVEKVGAGFYKVYFLGGWWTVCRTENGKSWYGEQYNHGYNLLQMTEEFNTKKELMEYIDQHGRTF